MDLKKQKQLLTKSLRILNKKKLYSFTDLAAALKVSPNTLRAYELNQITEIAEIIEKNRHEKPKEISSKKRSKTSRRIKQKIVPDKRLRSYEEVKAKLFAMKAYKQKNYNRLTDSAKRLTDKLIGLIEWVIFEDTTDITVTKKEKGIKNETSQ